MTTNRHFNEKKGNINPKRSMSQKSYVEITEETAIFIEDALKVKLKEYGKVPENYIIKLPQSDVKIKID